MGDEVDASGWRDLYPGVVRTPDDAVRFVEAVGFCTWGPIKSLAFPNLADAMGASALETENATWFWKDDLHVERRLFFGRVVRGQTSFVANDYLPDLIAALGGRGMEGERDPEELYAEGRLSREAKAICDLLREQGATPTRGLRSGALLSGSVAERALVELQRRLIVCKVGITGRTRGTYSYVWDLAERFVPDAFREAAATAPSAARARIRGQLEAFGITPDPALESRLFLWRGD